MRSGNDEHSLDAAFIADRRFLWGLCYRMTGCAAEADDLVQETFVHAMERPPARQDQPWRPWLVRVALNLTRDALRRRKRRAYPGPWLPAPVQSNGDSSLLSFDPISPDVGVEARYDLMESVSFAFLLALEALTPRQRAVLLLRDVFDYSVRETAEALNLSETNVKTTLHRARRALTTYDRERRRSAPRVRSDVAHILVRFLERLAAHDVPAIERMLADGVRVITDGGGEFVAAARPIVGRSNASRFLLGVTGRGGEAARVAVRQINGWPAAVIELPQAGRGCPPRLVFRVEVDEEGHIETVHIVAASRKMTTITAVA